MTASTKQKNTAPTALVESARAVLVTESQALQKLAESLNGSFTDAAHIIMNAKGRVVVSGMGKSGHIARKIAATMASTGTPAFFVHPGEASHGDLGMIMPDDVVIAISNSGETSELSDLVAYTRRFKIKLIGITSRSQSALGQAADVVLLLPPEPEVGSLGLAPTTSTTMTLALGDALAVAILEAKGFTKEDFRNFHPGGKLGKVLLRVNDLMHKADALPLVKTSTPMPDVLVTMTQKSFGCVGVLDEKEMLVGVITDGDLRRHMSPQLLTQKAADIMTSNPLSVAPRLLAAEALQLLNEKKRTNLFVVEDGKAVGIIHVHDLLRAGIV